MVECQATPAEQFAQDEADKRNLRVIYMIEAEGMRQVDIAKALRLSNSRVHQLYYRGLKKQRRGQI